jgi:SPP1 family predicted phage head-tail adaptor
MDIGALRHRVIIENPGTAVADLDGGYTEVQTAAVPSPIWASIVPATARDLERVVASAVQSTATHVVTVRYHPAITTKTRLRFGSRVFAVTGVQNQDERNLELKLTCEEIVA